MVLIPSKDARATVIRLPETSRRDPDWFFDFCQVNEHLQVERNAQGEIQIMAPPASEIGYREGEAFHELRLWAGQDGTGIAFNSNTGFVLPNGANRSPDAAWVKRSRLARLSAEQKKKFLPLCPDFVIEVRSPSDRLARLQEKMEEYRENGACLGWLIDPQQRKVHIYRPGLPVEKLNHPKRVKGDPELPGFVMELSQIWKPDF